MSQTTRYGFKWGVATITRLADIKGTKVLGVQAGKHDLEIAISRTGGRSLRVWRDGKELK